MYCVRISHLKQLESITFYFILFLIRFLHLFQILFHCHFPSASFPRPCILFPLGCYGLMLGGVATKGSGTAQVR